MNIRLLLEELLIEADKKDVLINKLGFSETNANVLSATCGPLAVFFANKFIDAIMQREGIKDRKEAVLKLNNGTYIYHSRNNLTSIMDWVRVGLNGNLQPYKNLTIHQLLDESNKWHKELQIGGGDINYVEKNNVILDFRKDGIGFYWVDLNTNNSPEECERMGHCGRTNYGNTIYSLREVKKVGDKYTSNTSHLTAAISNDGIIKQMKGSHNSKPDAKYFPYIVPLIMSDYVKGFGSEYDSKNDFKLSDLGEDQIKMIYSKKPELFNTYSGRKLLQKIGITANTGPKTFILKIDIDDIDEYVKGDYTIRRYKNKEGRERKVGLFETIMSEDIFELYDSDGYEGDWKDALDYYVDKTSEEKIWNMVREYAKKNEIDIEDLDLEDAIKETDYDDIKTTLSSSFSDAHADDYYEHLRNTLKKCLEEYGELKKFDYDGIEIEVNFDSIINAIIDYNGEEYLDELMGDCNEDPLCVLKEAIGNEYFEKPKFDIDDRWTPDVNVNYFNEILKDRLSEI
jgi:hypothetical protein